MKLRSMKKVVLLLGWIAVAPCLGAVPPRILSLSASDQLSWTNSQPGLFTCIEMSTNLLPGSWAPVRYGSVTDGTMELALPKSKVGRAFYRVAVVTNIPDPSLVLHLPFDNNFSNGEVLDISGYGNNGIRYSLTNWPSVGTGPDGSQAGEFHRQSSASGDYVAVPDSPVLDHLTNGTILVWAYYTTNSYGNSDLIDAGWWAYTNSWTLGRNYSLATELSLATGSNSAGDDVITYPDATRDYDTGGWHYYGVTWDGTNFVGYFDGLPFSTNSQAGFPELTVGNNYHWLAIGCRNSDGTPQWGDDPYPDGGWMDGGIDDVRIYNRALTAPEIHALYASFDKVPPTVPTNLTAMAASSTQVELRWELSTDDFQVQGYKISRDGKIIGQAIGRLFCDTGLQPDTTYQYSVEAYDVAGNLSGESSSVPVTTSSTGSGVTIILDESDGAPWVSQFGNWNLRTNLAAAYLGRYVQDGDTGKGTKSVVYRPSITENGSYAISIWYPSQSNGATNVPVDIVAAGVTNTVYVNQVVNGGAWNPLGTFDLPVGTNSYVRIRNDGTSGYVEADAVKFSK